MKVFIDVGAVWKIDFEGEIVECLVIEDMDRKRNRWKVFSLKDYSIDTADTDQFVNCVKEQI